MLDKLGLDKKDAEGYRLRTDGGGRLRSRSRPMSASCPFTKIAEMIVEQWKKIGIRGDVQELERGLATARMRANEHQIYFETQWGADNMFGHAPWFFPADGGEPDRARSTGPGTRARGPRARRRRPGCAS